MSIFEKKVLATITEEEAEMFVDMELEVEAVNEMQENLLTQMKVALKKKRKFWDCIEEKYEISGALTFNRQTREISRTKG